MCIDYVKIYIQNKKKTLDSNNYDIWKIYIYSNKIKIRLKRQHSLNFHDYILIIILPDVASICLQ